MKKNITLFLLLIFTIPVINAQDLSKFKESERNKKLIEIAKTEYSKEKYKEYYRIYDVPKISKMPVQDVPSIKKEYSPAYGSKPGDMFYMIEFPYDRTKEQFETNYAAIVYIWEKSGTPFAIELGNGYTLKVK